MSLTLEQLTPILHLQPLCLATRPAFGPEPVYLFIRGVYLEDFYGDPQSEPAWFISYKQVGEVVGGMVSATYSALPLDHVNEIVLEDGSPVGLLEYERSVRSGGEAKYRNIYPEKPLALNRNSDIEPLSYYRAGSPDETPSSPPLPFRYPNEVNLLDFLRQFGAEVPLTIGGVDLSPMIACLENVQLDELQETMGDAINQVIEGQPQLMQTLKGAVLAIVWKVADVVKEQEGMTERWVTIHTLAEILEDHVKGAKDSF